MDTVTLFGDNLRRARNAADLSQEELAFRAGMKRSYVSDMERGTRNPTVRALGRIANALEIPPHTLLLPLTKSNR
ncbi:helix-turn-helix domain-containing protein [Brevundimonas sp.]|uniref:helix-turn-helix domain-containing protein n=1 Tax=Brevundimonas sp. TaxID=1871086 RepID=UPI0037C0A5E9